MQVWDQVKIVDEKHPHAGRAGVVSAVLENGNKGTVKLDETADRSAEVVAVKAEQVQFLGR